MSDRKPGDEMERRIVAALDAESRGLDARTRGRLDRARGRALAEADARPRSHWVMPLLAAAGSAAMIALLTLAPSGDPSRTPAPRTDDLDLLTREEFELFVEDPAFYAWVAQGAPPPAAADEEEET